MTGDSMYMQLGQSAEPLIDLFGPQRIVTTSSYTR